MTTTESATMLTMEEFEIFSREYKAKMITVEKVTTYLDAKRKDLFICEAYSCAFQSWIPNPFPLGTDLRAPENWYVWRVSLPRVKG